MRVEYHEASAITAAPQVDGRTTLDEIHKLAWRLYLGGQAAKPMASRPFIFRFDPVPSAASTERLLLTIRADHSFAGSVSHALSIREGDRLRFDYSYMAMARRGSIEIDLERPRWEEKALAGLGRAGLACEADDIDCATLGRWQHWHKGRGWTVLTATAEATVTDGHAFAGAYLDGTGRKRGYGFGLLRVRRDSPCQPVMLEGESRGVEQAAR